MEGQHTEITKFTNTRTMLPALIFIFCIATNVQPIVGNQNISLVNHHTFQVDHSYGIGSDIKKSFGAKAHAIADCKSNFRGYNCSTTVKKLKDYDLKYNKFCYYNIKKKDNEEILPSIKFSMQKNKAVFVYETIDTRDYTFQNVNQIFAIVDSDNEDHVCENTTITIPLGSIPTYERQMNLATIANMMYHDDGSLDIFVDGSCHGARCKYSFDNEIKLISQNVPFLPLKYINHSVEIFPSTKSDAYFALVAEWPPRTYGGPSPSQNYNNRFHSHTLLYVSEGDPMELATFEYRNGADQELFVDNSNGYFSACQQLKIDAIHCMLFNDSVIRFYQTVAISSDEKLITTFNLPTGEILLVKSRCNKSFCKGLSFEKWPRDVEDQEYTFKDTEFNLPILKAFVHAEKENKMCVSMYNSDKSDYHLLLECFESPFVLNAGPRQSCISMLYLLTFITIFYFTVTYTF